ncbi:hypothetical protein [Vaccinium witches'-broom phytoplasma]|nr:hypothetical protein [Vaccinium witches'-broom phytoplasma]
MKIFLQFLQKNTLLRAFTLNNKKARKVKTAKERITLQKIKEEVL